MLETLIINGITLDVYFLYEVEKDPYGTGDSPTYHNIQLVAVETLNDTVDLLPILCNTIIEKIENEIFNIVTGA